MDQSTSILTSPRSSLTLPFALALSASWSAGVCPPLMKSSPSKRSISGVTVYCLYTCPSTFVDFVAESRCTNCWMNEGDTPGFTYSNVNCYSLCSWGVLTFITISSPMTIFTRPLFITTMVPIRPSGGGGGIAFLRLF